LWARSGSSLWQISQDGTVVDKIGNVFSPKPAAVGAQNLAIGLGSIWTVQPRSVLRIDPSTDRVTARIDTPRGCDQVAAGPSVMFLGCRDSRLFKIEPDTNTATLVTTVGVSPAGLAFGAGSVWWLNFSEAGGVSKIGPANGTIKDMASPNATFVVPTGHGVWFIDGNGNAFSIDPTGGNGAATHALKKARVASGAISDGGSVLINDGDLVAFDSDTGAVTRRTHVSGTQSFREVGGIAVLGQNIWLVDPKGERIVAVPR
jgi:hypothetical protein